MKLLKWLREFVAWRWAPFVGLVAAALLYVVLVVLLVPSEISSSEEGGDAGTSTSTFAGRGATEHTKLSRGSPRTAIAAMEPGGPNEHLNMIRALPTPTPAATPFPRRGFSPPLERPEPPPPPPPPPPPAAPPPPPPVAAGPPPEANLGPPQDPAPQAPPDTPDPLQQPAPEGSGE
jgi:outer membrane biosynthesis protein TonB